MLPSDSLISLINGFYKPERAQAILAHLENAQVSAGFDTIVAELSNVIQKPVPYLVIHELEKPPRLHVLKIGEHLIGRVPTCAVVLEDGQISRFHSLLTIHTDGNMTIRDLQSRNGTQVNGERVPAIDAFAIHIGDRVTLGRTSLLLNIS